MAGNRDRQNGVVKPLADGRYIARCRERSVIAAAANGHLSVFPDAVLQIREREALFYRGHTLVWTCESTYAEQHFDIDCPEAASSIADGRYIARCREKTAIAAAANGHLAVFPDAALLVEDGQAFFYRGRTRVWTCLSTYAGDHFDIEPYAIAQ